MFAIDAHLDLAMNAVLWDRDLKLSAHQTREIERAEGMTEKGRCTGTVGLPDLRAGEFGLVFATVLARTKGWRNRRTRCGRPRRVRAHPRTSARSRRRGRCPRPGA